MTDDKTTAAAHRRIRLALAAVARVEQAREQALTERDAAVYALHQLGWSTRRIADHYKDQPGMSEAWVRQTVRIGKAVSR